MALAQNDISVAHKDKKNPFYNSRYADLASVWDAIRGPLTTNGLCISQGGVGLRGDRYVRTKMCHESGQWMFFDYPVTPIPKPLRNDEKEIVKWLDEDPQALGSANTYARRYSLMAIAGVAPADDDGNTASAGPPPPATKRRRKPTKKEQAAADRIQNKVDSVGAPPPSRPDDDPVETVIEKKKAAARTEGSKMIAPEQRAKLVAIAAGMYTEGDQPKADSFVSWSFWRKHFAATPIQGMSWKKVTRDMAEEMIGTFKDETKFKTIVKLYEEPH